MVQRVPAMSWITLTMSANWNAVEMRLSPKRVAENTLGPIPSSTAVCSHKRKRALGTKATCQSSALGPLPSAVARPASTSQCTSSLPAPRSGIQTGSETYDTVASRFLPSAPSSVAHSAARAFGDTSPIVARATNNWDQEMEIRVARLVVAERWWRVLFAIRISSFIAPIVAPVRAGNVGQHTSGITQIGHSNWSTVDFPI